MFIQFNNFLPFLTLAIQKRKDEEKKNLTKTGDSKIFLYHEKHATYSPPLFALLPFPPHSRLSLPHPATVEDNSVGEGSNSNSESYEFREGTIIV